MAMSSPSDLRKMNVRPRKGMGQHFLISQAILEEIAAAANLQQNDIVVEVGPGVGALTGVMAPQVGSIVAVELDAELIPRLAEAMAPFGNVRIVNGDILELHLAETLAQVTPAAGGIAPYKVVANLPYYITTPSLRYFFEQEQRPSLIVVTIQDEVARRMVAHPPDMNFLAVLVQFYGAPEIVRQVPPGAFYPPPKVESAVVRIVLRQSLALSPEATGRFFRLVSAGFSQPRKQLHNPLTHGTGLPRERIMAALDASGIDNTRRAQTLGVDDWLRLNAQLSG
jgi:16S rRNA (adenine1518-N6/adenine1519-N6)-dimethyltransferase